MPASPFAVDVTPDWEALRDCILRKGTPRRVHHIELFLDHELKIALCERYGLMDGVDPGDPHFGLKREIAVQRFCGYDYVRQGIEGLDMPMNRSVAADTAELAREGGRSFMDEHRGPDHQLGRVRGLPLARPAEGPHRRPGVVPEEPARRHVRHRQRRVRPLRRVPHLADGLRDALLRPLRPARPGQGHQPTGSSRPTRSSSPGCSSSTASRSSGAATTWASRPAR